MTRAVSWLAATVADVPEGEDWLTEPEAARLAAMPYAKRRIESRLGRWTAKRALARAAGLGSRPEELREVTVANAPDGAPEAMVGGEPAGFAVSLTDRADWAVCAVLKGSASIGCDLELVEPRSAAFVADYLTPREQAAAAWDGMVLPNVIWSAKESVLKVLRTGLRRDTRSVEVVLSGEGAGWRPFTATSSEGAEFPGWWRRFGDFVLTIAATEPTTEPACQVEPPPLEGAVPGHSWMERPLIG